MKLVSNFNEKYKNYQYITTITTTTTILTTTTQLLLTIINRSRSNKKFTTHIYSIPETLV